VDGVTGNVTVHSADDKGKANEVTERLNLPADLANGMVPILLKNLPSSPTQLSLSMVVATPKPRLIKLAISAAGEEPFAIGPGNYKAVHYVVRVELGGVAGVVRRSWANSPRIPTSGSWVARRRLSSNQKDRNLKAGPRGGSSWPVPAGHNNVRRWGVAASESDLNSSLLFSADIAYTNSLGGVRGLPDSWSRLCRHTVMLRRDLCLAGHPPVIWARKSQAATTR
jgi:hypothetical protein